MHVRNVKVASEVAHQTAPQIRNVKVASEVASRVGRKDVVGVSEV